MLAEITEGLSVEETWQLLDHAELHREAEIFSFLPVARQVELVSGEPHPSNTRVTMRDTSSAS